MALSAFDYFEKLSGGWSPQENYDAAEGKGYDPWMMNNILSLYVDTLPIADQLNRLPHLGRDEHFAFVLSTIRTRTRPKRWYKKPNMDELSDLARRYRCSLSVARDIHRLLLKLGQTDRTRRAERSTSRRGSPQDS